MTKSEIDVLIVGGGLIGTCLMHALNGIGYSVLLAEANPLTHTIDQGFDARTLALSPSSKRILNTLGIWEHIKEHISPIEFIHVSHQHHFGSSRFHGTPDKPLGYVIEMHHISSVVHRLFNQEQVLTPARLTSLNLNERTAELEIGSEKQQIKAGLIVAADGAESSLRTLCHLSASIKEYNQHALVANIELARPHEYRAYERFTPNGPLALLPMLHHRMALVWANSPIRTQQLIELSENDFLRALHHAFGYRLGRFTKVGRRYSYPLKQVLMPQQVKWPVIFLGNAAHTLHPIAGQGFNLGLRDVAALAQSIKQWGLNTTMAEHYVRSRTPDQKVITRATNGLVQVFSSQLPGLGLARSLGLTALDLIPPLKNTLIRYAQGFGGTASDLVCDIALSGEVHHES